MARVRSPNYPAISLPEAVKRIKDIHTAQQTTPEPRDVVVQHMGYGSVNGRSLKALSSLVKYGFLDYNNAEGYRVSERAISVLYPEDEAEKNESLLKAARTPKLFSEIFDRWKGRPSEESLSSYLIRNGFNTGAIESVTRSFYATFDFIQEFISEESPVLSEEDVESGGESPAEASPNVKQIEKVSNPYLNITKPVFDFETVSINTKIDNQRDLQTLVDRLMAIKDMLPEDSSDSESVRDFDLDVFE